MNNNITSANNTGNTLPNLKNEIIIPIIPSNKTINNDSINNNINSSINKKNIDSNDDLIKNILIGYYIFATLAIILYFINNDEIEKEEYYLKLKTFQFKDPELEYSNLNKLINNYIYNNSIEDLCPHKNKLGCLKFKLHIIDLINDSSKNTITKEQIELFKLMYNSYSHPLYRLIKYTLIGYIAIPLILLSSTIPFYAR